MRRGLTLSAALADELLVHARAGFPLEACGLLSGDGATARATRFHPAANAEESATAYRIDPGEVVRIVDRIERADDDLVAIFHSHTRTPAVPSATDVREARWAGVLHLIASLAAAPGAEPRLRAWRIEDGASREVAVCVE